ncbi:MAG TPA: bifunctional riboflavin kinase/FAD synthetase, partial [Thiomicrospira sp.]|nr:bifunctional riboflavin kinase/FAD synthetase [Thiomicrospira sp.]
WNTDVYGQYVSIKLHQFIRPEQKFNGIDELKSQIILDVKQAKKQLNLI